MTREVMLSKLNEIFCDVFGGLSFVITEATNADDIEEWDSLSNITILASIQDEFGVSFSLDDISEMKNVGDILTAIEGKYNV